MIKMSHLYAQFFSRGLRECIIRKNFRGPNTFTMMKMQKELQKVTA